MFLSNLSTLINKYEEYIFTLNQETLVPKDLFHSIKIIYCTIYYFYIKINRYPFIDDFGNMTFDDIEAIERNRQEREGRITLKLYQYVHCTVMQ
jgi:hypothetical protein